MRDRTSEFFSCAESASQRSESRQHLLPKLKSKTEFTKAASLISKEINDTVARLTKLTTLAKKNSLFEDKPQEINELIYIIKQDIAKINKQIGQLSDYLVQQKLPNKYSKEHSHNVISSLQSKLANTSDAFTSVLKVRSDNLKEQTQRKEQYSFAGPSTTGNTDSPLYNPERKFTQQVSNEAVIDFGSGFMQQELALDNQNSAYIQERNQTIESIESTIAELGQIYTRFASVIAEQRELVQRIDDNIVDVEMNVAGAHTQLLKYYQGISNNRTLMLKIFGVMITFFLMFVMLS
ncbi:cis-Golgi t-SNARE syntaxin [Terramyces sp. JEL0728]|nr:cis-Golgi t-SNARE syntaxin [Terramyces sp. JEL0728]